MADFEEGAGGASPSLNHPVSGTAVVPPQRLAPRRGDVRRHDLEPLSRRRPGRHPQRRSTGQRGDERPARSVGTALDTTGTAAGFFAGTIDEVRIWSVARSLSQIQATKNSEITTPQTNLLGVWNLNEGSGSSLGDNSGNSITGAAVASPTWVPGFVPPVTNGAPNAPTLNAPGNGATGISTSPTLSVGVSDPDADPLTVTFFGRPLASGSFTQIAQQRA